MLDTTNPVYLQPTVIAVPPRVISGRYLAHNKLDARGRARLAADLISGRAVPGPLTAAQITNLCRSNKVYVAEALDPGRARRLKQRRLQQAWEAVDPNHRAEFCRVVGVEKVWDVLAQAVG